MCELVNQLLAVKAISDKDMEKLKSDKYLFYDPLILMDLRHEQVRQKFRNISKCTHPKMTDIERSRILKEEEQRKRIKARDISIVNKKLEAFKREIHLSRKIFEKQSINMQPTSISNKGHLTKNVTLPLNLNLVEEQKIFEFSGQCNTKEIHFEESHRAPNTVIDDSLVKFSVFTGNKKVISSDCEVPVEHLALSGSPAVSASVEAEIEHSNINIIKQKIQIACGIPIGKDTSEAKFCQVIKKTADESKLQVLVEDTIFKCDPNEKHKQLCQENFALASEQSPTKCVMDVNKQISQPKSEILFEKCVSFEGEERRHYSQSEYHSVDETKNVDKKMLAAAFVKKFAKENVQRSNKGHSIKANQEINQSDSLKEDTKSCRKKESSESELLHKYWKLWKDYTFREVQQARVEKLLDSLDKYQRMVNSGQRGHVIERVNCHSANCILESQNLKNNHQNHSGALYDNKWKRRSKSVHCQSLPTTFNERTSENIKRRGRQKSFKPKGCVDDIDQKVRELSAERHQREAAMCHDKEEMHIKPYGSIPHWVLQPVRLIAVESAARCKERQEAIKLRLETKRLVKEKQETAEKLRLEAETKRMQSIYMLAWEHYRQRVSRRLLINPLRALVVESKRKEARAVALESYLLLRKYWKVWWHTTATKFSVFVEALNRIRMRRAFDALLEVRDNAVRLYQVSEDFYNVWILERRVFILWKLFVVEKVTQEAELMQTATQHYNRCLLCHCFWQWCKVRDESKKRKRLEAWHTRVREILPDFTPPEL